MENRSGLPAFVGFSLSHSLSHTHTYMQEYRLSTCQKRHQTMRYSAPLWAQWEVPGPTSPHTIGPKACPTPTIVPYSTHTHTMATLEPGVLLCNSPHTKPHTNPYVIRWRKIRAAEVREEEKESNFLISRKGRKEMQEQSAWWSRSHIRKVKVRNLFFFVYMSISPAFESIIFFIIFPFN